MSWNWPHILLIVYLILGPGAWLLVIASLFLGISRMNRLITRRYELLKDVPPPPRVTILVPAKDEGPRIRRAIVTVLLQDYLNFNVIAIDDRSSDDTGQVLDELAAADHRLRVIHIQSGELPEGWTGKCNALQRGIEHADGEWLLFVDSDVVLASNALSCCIAAAIDRGYDAVSLLTAIECHTFWEKLLAPLAAGTWSVMNLVSLTNNDNRKTALANGQFFLIRKDVHAAVGGHAAVRQEPAEDVQLMRLMKSAGYKVRLFMGAHLAATRMHATLPQIIRGWARIYSTTSQRHAGRIIGAMLFFIISVISVYPALIAGAIGFARQGVSPWVTASLLHVTLMIGYLGIIYRMSGNRERHAFGFLIAAPVMLWIFVRALWMCRTGRMNWRGTSLKYIPMSIEPIKPPT